MLLSPLAVLIAALPLAVLGGEFPTYNGVVGGVPPDVHTNQEIGQEVLETPAGDVVTQAGSLRYVENSGVCGKSPPLNHRQPVCSPQGRNNPRRVLGFGLCGLDLHAAHVVLVLCGAPQSRHCAAHDLVERRGELFCISKFSCQVLNTPKPGSSSMIGLFQEHGPCLINNGSSTVRLNPQSWNQNSNM